MHIVRTDDEIADLENWAIEGFDLGSRYPGMSYEQGILDTLEWLQGITDQIYDDARE